MDTAKNAAFGAIKGLQADKATKEAVSSAKTAAMTALSGLREGGGATAGLAPGAGAGEGAGTGPAQGASTEAEAELSELERVLNEAVNLTSSTTGRFLLEAPMVWAKHGGRGEFEAHAEFTLSKSPPRPIFPEAEVNFLAVVRFKTGTLADRFLKCPAWHKLCGTCTSQVTAVRVEKISAPSMLDAAVGAPLSWLGQLLYSAMPFGGPAPRETLPPRPDGTPATRAGQDAAELYQRLCTAMEFALAFNGPIVVAHVGSSRSSEGSIGTRTGGTLTKKSSKFFRVGIFLDFVWLTTRTPHGAYVRRARRNRIDRHGGDIERLGLQASGWRSTPCRKTCLCTAPPTARP